MSGNWKHDCVVGWTKPWLWRLVIYNRGFDFWWYETVALASGNRKPGFGAWLCCLVHETVAVVSGDMKPWLFSLVNEWTRKKIKPVCVLWPVLNPCGLILCWHWNRDFTAALITPHNHLYLPHNAAPHLSVIYIGGFHTRASSLSVIRFAGGACRHMHSWFELSAFKLFGRFSRRHKQRLRILLRKGTKITSSSLLAKISRSL